MSKVVIIRLVETFFRRWWLYLLPLVVLTGAGVNAAANRVETYRSTGTLYVQSETFLSSLTALRPGDVGWQTAAAYYNQQLAGLLRTDAFLALVLDRAGADLGDSGAAPVPSLQDLRTSVSSWPSGENLVQVSTSDPDPVVAHAVVGAVIESFVQWQIDADVSESSAAQAFFSEQIGPYEDEVAAAREALDGFVQQLPDPAVGGTPRSLAQDITLDRLNADVARSEERLAAVRTKEEEARLATAQTERDVRQQFQVVDLPEVPAAPEGGLRQMAMDVGLFVAMGLAVSIGGLLAATFLDRSVRSQLEVTQVLGAELLTVLPEQRGPGRRLRLRTRGAR